MTKFTSTHDKQKFNKVEEQRERREKRVVKERKGSVDESEKQSIMCLFFLFVLGNLSYLPSFSVTLAW